MRVWSGVTEKLTGDSTPALTGLYGRPFFIGIASQRQGEVASFDKYSNIRGRIGYGPLTRALEDFFACGGQKSQALARVLAPDSDPTFSTIVHAGSGTGTVTLGGTPNDAYAIVIEIVRDGLISLQGTPPVIRFSQDGGNSWSENLSLDSGGEITLGNTGITATFEGALEESWIVGDTYTFTSERPTCETETILAAMAEVLAAYRHQFEFFVLLGTSDSAFWTSVATLMTQEFNKHNPIFALCEGQSVAAATKDEDVATLIADTASFSSRFVAVTALECRMVNAVGEKMSRTPLGALAGILSKGRVSDSVGVLKDDFGKILPAISVMPDNAALPNDAINEGDLTLLDEAGYIVPRWYEGYPGFFFNNGNLMSAPGDPFDDIEKIRVAGKLIRLCRVAALRTLHLDADSQAKWAFGGRSGLEYLKAELQRAARPMFIEGELYRFEPHILSTPDDVYLTKQVTVRLDFTTNPKMKKIELVFDLVSPDEFERRSA